LNYETALVLVVSYCYVAAAAAAADSNHVLMTVLCSQTASSPAELFHYWSMLSVNNKAQSSQFHHWLDRVAVLCASYVSFGAVVSHQILMHIKPNS